MNRAVADVRRLDVIERLRRTMRSSPWLVIAVMLHLILFAALSVVYVTRSMKEKEERIATVEVRTRPPEQPATASLPEVPPIRDLVPPLPEGPVEIVPEDTPEFVPLDQQFTPVDLHDDIGNPNALDGLVTGNDPSSNIGVGFGGNRGSGPTPFPDRVRGPGQGGGGPPGRPADRTLARTEEAVLEGWCWLLRHQGEDGSWAADSLRERCSLGSQCVGAHVDFTPAYDPGLTSLVLLSFLGAGLSHQSEAEIVDAAMGVRHFVGKDLGRATKWLLAQVGPDGSFSDFGGSLYNEAIGALALAEAYGVTGNKQLREPAQRMINFLVRAQKANPAGSGRWGWRYTPGGDSVADMSVTGWMVMALKSAQMAELVVPQEALEGALEFAGWVTGEDGLVGYLDPAAAGQRVTGHNDHFDYHVGTLSALGMLTRSFVAHDIQDPFLELAAGQIARDLPAVSEDGLSIDYYYWYYATLALNQFDGPDSPRRSGRYWEPWNQAMQAAVLALQDRNEERDICSRGGWLRPDRWSFAGGPVYSTALNVLTLEVYYRYPNVFSGVDR